MPSLLNAANWPTTRLVPWCMRPWCRLSMSPGVSGSPVLPPGYYGPLLIVVCGLLFYVDAHLKPWRQQAAVLSHLSFGLYGLSIIALLLAVKTPLALLCTLILAVVLYGFVTWQYATLPPLYLLLGCAGWLYHEVMLHHLPYPWYFVGSLPPGWGCGPQVGGPCDSGRPRSRW